VEECDGIVENPRRGVKGTLASEFPFPSASWVIRLIGRHQSENAMILVKAYLARRHGSPGLEGMPLNVSPYILNEANKYSLEVHSPRPRDSGTNTPWSE
jgi:hypothetical protein